MDSKGHRYRQVRPDSAATDANFGGVIAFAINSSSDEFVDLSRSYVSVGLEFKRDAAAATGTPAVIPPLVYKTAVATDQQIAIARLGLAGAFANVQLDIGGVSVERNDHPMQSAMVSNLLMKTANYNNTSGSMFAAQLSHEERVKIISSPVGSVLQQQTNIGFQPPLGVWHSDKLIRALEGRLQLQVHSAWKQRIIESGTYSFDAVDGTTGAIEGIYGYLSPGKPLVPGAADSYDIVVKSIVLMLATWSPDEGVPIQQCAADIVEAVGMTLNTSQLNSVQQHTVNWSVEPSTYSLVTFLQGAGAEAHTGFSLSRTSGAYEVGDGSPVEPALVSDLWVDYAGKRTPEQSYGLNLLTAQGLARVYNEAFLDCVSEMGASGTVLSLEEYRNSPAYCHKLVKGAAVYDDRLSLEMNFAASFTGIMYNIALYELRVLLNYDSSGRINRVRVAKSDRELQAAVDQAEADAATMP